MPGRQPWYSASRMTSQRTICASPTRRASSASVGPWLGLRGPTRRASSASVGQLAGPEGPDKASIISISWPLAGPEGPDKASIISISWLLAGPEGPDKASIISISWPLAGPEGPDKVSIISLSWPLAGSEGPDKAASSASVGPCVGVRNSTRRASSTACTSPDPQFWLRVIIHLSAEVRNSVPPHFPMLCGFSWLAQKSSVAHAFFFIYQHFLVLFGVSIPSPSRFNQPAVNRIGGGANMHAQQCSKFSC